MFAAADFIKYLLREAVSEEEMAPHPVSTHLWYPVPQGKAVEGFQCEVTVPEGKDPIHTYYMACGWHRGYMGCQVNSPYERRVLFSCWDDGKGGKVETVDSHIHALVQPFGNEGTGMQAILQYKWKTGEPQTFCVTCKPEPERNSTVYSGFYKLNEDWVLVASFRTPGDGKHMSGLYSFLENFQKDRTQERSCRYSKQMIKYAGEPTWTPKTEARCTTTKKLAADDYFNFCVEDKTFCMTINGPKGKECQCVKPDKLALASD